MLEGRPQRIAFTRRKILVQGEKKREIKGSGGDCERFLNDGLFP